jgi:hypothetical protein
MKFDAVVASDDETLAHLMHDFTGFVDFIYQARGAADIFPMAR